MRLEDDIKLDYADVLIRPKRSTLTSRRDVDLNRAFTFKHSKATWAGVPIMAANMDGVGTFGMMTALAGQNMFTCFVKNLQPQDFQSNLNVLIKAKKFWAVSTGSSDQDFARLMAISDNFKFSANHLEFVCIDIANGYSEHFGNFISKVRERLPNTTIIAGNVCTADMTQELVLRGADIVKIGIGPGAVCTTRIKTGVGFPQLSAVIECADAAHGLGAHIIADGGCTCPGDVAKAFAGGADFVMLGSMLAGHKEGGGDVISKLYQTQEVDPNNLKPLVVEKQFVKFYGMSSEAANKKHFGGLKDYRAAEGREVLVPYKGDVSDTVQEILGGLRSTMTYVGASELKHLSKCATFVRTSRQYNNWFEGQTLAK